MWGRGMCGRVCSWGLTSLEGFWFVCEREWSGGLREELMNLIGNVSPFDSCRMGQPGVSSMVTNPSIHPSKHLKLSLTYTPHAPISPARPTSPCDNKPNKPSDSKRTNQPSPYSTLIPLLTKTKERKKERKKRSERSSEKLTFVFGKSKQVRFVTIFVGPFSKHFAFATASVGVQFSSFLQRPVGIYWSAP